MDYPFSYTGPYPYYGGSRAMEGWIASRVRPPTCIDLSNDCGTTQVGAFGVAAGQSAAVSVNITPPGSTNASPQRQSSRQTDANINYLVRIIPREKKSDAKTFEWHNVHDVFTSPAALRFKLIDSFKAKVPATNDFEIGYIAKRGNGKRWIEDEADLASMYKHMESCETITLFCEGRSESTAHASTGSKQKRKSQGDEATGCDRLDHEDEVKRLALDLADKHGTEYNDKQLKLWARMVVNKQHDDLDEPPNIPLITGGVKKTPRKEGLQEALTGAANAFAKAFTSCGKDSLPGTPTTTPHTPANVGISPSSKARLSSEYISQLKTLQNLRDSGALSDEEFIEQKAFALDSIRSMNK